MAGDACRIPFTAADRRAGYRYELSILQAEFSLTQVLDRPVTGRIFFEEVIRENLDIGRPGQVQLIFDRKVSRRNTGPIPHARHHRRSGAFAARRLQEDPHQAIPQGAHGDRARLLAAPTDSGHSSFPRSPLDLEVDTPMPEYRLLNAQTQPTPRRSKAEAWGSAGVPC